MASPSSLTAGGQVQCESDRCLFSFDAQIGPLVDLSQIVRPGVPPVSRSCSQQDQSQLHRRGELCGS